MTDYTKMAKEWKKTNEYKRYPDLDTVDGFAKWLDEREHPAGVSCAGYGMCHLCTKPRKEDKPVCNCKPQPPQNKEPQKEDGWEKRFDEKFSTPSNRPPIPFHSVTRDAIKAFIATEKQASYNQGQVEASREIEKIVDGLQRFTFPTVVSEHEFLDTCDIYRKAFQKYRAALKAKTDTP